MVLSVLMVLVMVMFVFVEGAIWIGEVVDRPAFE
jgi:hypothetical protein